MVEKFLKAVTPELADVYILIAEEGGQGSRGLKGEEETKSGGGGKALPAFQNGCGRDVDSVEIVLGRKCEADGKEAKAELAQRNMFPSAQIKMRLLSPSSSPATSPTMSNSSSPTPPTPAAPAYNQKMTGIPCVAAASRYTAPVHIDVGGTIYTSSLETLTKLDLSEVNKSWISEWESQKCLIGVNYRQIEHLEAMNWLSTDEMISILARRIRYPESRLAKLFNGSIPIVLDSLKQHYFIDRDGGMFRHILNFMRNSRLLIPENFADLDLLLEEARYFDIAPMCRQLEQMKKERIKNEGNCNYECVALHVSPDLGERVMLSGGRALLDEVFPETTQAVIDARSGVAWHQQDARHVIRFPLNGYCKLNSVQAITRLLNAGFRVVASNGGGVEGQQFSEYLFVRQAVNT
ncbi:BTB/POZ domain-containing protein kctd15-like [Dufourea novaeangliae]|uniref:BTB/POZ domain-containing protein kctd15-like n=1 Tax=Dufourea novaeangliae TaxID=178035 RepID=A0A154P9E6_DUFNO|nr:BTB/POZ domain-containing protein kctd15-like [Dufourea novaeangliae]